MNGRETCKTFWSILALVLSPGELLSYRRRRPATPTKRRPRRKVKFLIFFPLPTRDYTIYQQPFFFCLSSACGFSRQYLSRFPSPAPTRWHSRVRDSVSPNFEKQRGPSDYNKYFPVRSNRMSRRKCPRFWMRPRCVPNFDNRLTESSAILRPSPLPPSLTSSLLSFPLFNARTCICSFLSFIACMCVCVILGTLRLLVARHVHAKVHVDVTNTILILMNNF